MLKDLFQGQAAGRLAVTRTVTLRAKAVALSLALGFGSCTFFAFDPASAAAAVCQPGQGVKTLYSEDFENFTGRPVWRSVPLLTGSSSIAESYWRYPPPPPGNVPAGGVLNAWADLSRDVSDSAFEMPASFTVAVDSYLTFSHRFTLRQDALGSRDGGRVEYSLDGGASWADAGRLAVGPAAGGYNGSVSTAGEPGQVNTLAGLPAFVGESDGYRSTRLNLSELTGRSVSFRFRLASGGGAAAPAGSFWGWAVDDVRVTACVDAPPPTTDGKMAPSSSRANPLSIRIKERPRQLLPGRHVVLRAEAVNNQDRAVTRARVCFRAPRKLVVGPRCLKIGRLPAGASADLRFSLRIRGRARVGSKIRFRFRFAAKGQAPAIAIRRLPVRNPASLAR